MPDDPFAQVRRDIDRYGDVGQEEWERDAEEIERLGEAYREEILASKAAFEETYHSLSTNLIDILPGFNHKGSRREAFRGDKEVRLVDLRAIPGDATFVYRDIRTGRGHAKVIRLNGPDLDDVFDELCVHSYELSHEIEPFSFWESLRNLFVR